MSAGLHWHWDASTLMAMLGVATVYAAGVLRLWRKAGRGRGLSHGAVMAFAAGMASLAVALLSPLAAMAEQLFAAHMVVHEIIMAVAAPLFILARPWGAMAWALPAALARLLKPMAGLTGGLSATLIQTAVIWFWHVPGVFRAATQSEALHVLQHLSFFASAVLFWQAMGRLSGRRAGAAVGWLFATSMHTGFLGALLLMAPRPWFPAQGGFGLSPLEDQQLGGAIMWVPGGLIYAVAALWMAAQWIARGGATPVMAGGYGDIAWEAQKRSKAKR